MVIVFLLVMLEQVHAGIDEGLVFKASLPGIGLELTKLAFALLIVFVNVSIALAFSFLLPNTFLPCEVSLVKRNENRYLFREFSLALLALNLALPCKFLLPILEAVLLRRVRVGQQ